MTTCPPTRRHDGWTPAVRAAFLEALATFGTVRAALLAVRRGRSGAYALRSRDPEFSAAWDRALVDALGPLETMLLERAISGEHVRTVNLAGRTVCEDHRFSDRLALRLLSRLDRRAALQVAAESLRSGQSGQSGSEAIPALRALAQ